MSKFILQLGHCVLTCQTIEFYLFSIVSKDDDGIFGDVDTYIRSAAGELTQHWNKTKAALERKCPELDKGRLDAYVRRRNWVIHNCVYEAVAKLRNIHDHDISAHVAFFDAEAEYFKGLAASLNAKTELDNLEDRKILEATCDAYLAALSKEAERIKNG